MDERLAELNTMIADLERTIDDLDILRAGALRGLEIAKKQRRMYQENVSGKSVMYNGVVRNPTTDKTHQQE